MSNEEIPSVSGTEEAMKKLNLKYEDKIAWGCFFAVKLALASRTVHARQVREEMAKRGLCEESEKEFWLGAVFRNLKDAGVLKHTGLFYSYSDPSRGIHERTIKLWEINPKSDISKYRMEPASTEKKDGVGGHDR